jgi:uracil-DNA glycosylase family 4
MCTQLLLKQQIRIVQPQVICTLGASALKSLTKTSYNITKIHGKALPYGDISILPTYHPAYVLRSRSQQDSFAKGLQNAYSLSVKRQSEF